MHIENTLVGDITVIRPVAQSLDASNITEFRAQIDPFIRDGSRILLELDRIEFVDSAGVGTLIFCLRHLTEHQGRLQLCALNRPVKALFDLMRMHRVFEIHPDRESALRTA